MKILIWNCKQGFHAKIERVAALRPDIAIIPECSNPVALPSSVRPELLPTTFKWFGKNATKGLSVVSFTDLRLTVADIWDETIEWVVPLQVHGSYEFNLLAVWAMIDPEGTNSYIGRIHRALDRYQSFIASRDTVVAGDFNSSSIWDGLRKHGNHSQAVERLAACDLVSSYHAYFGEQQGQETRPTFYLYHHKHRPFHIDFCFLPRTWLPRLCAVDVGRYEEWRHLSDHCPLVIDMV